MSRRLNLQAELTKIVGKNVYWQPPDNLKMNYPCIVYEERPIDISRADDVNYLKKYSWNVTLIRTYKDRDKTSEMVDKMLDAFKYCRHTNHSVVDGLIHDYYTIYY